MDRFKRARINEGNLTSLLDAFDINSRACKQAIRRDNREEVEALTKTCALILGALMENRLMWLASLNNGFPEARERRILSARNSKDMWRRLLDESFAERYSVPVSNVPNGLSFTARSYHAGMLSVLDDWLYPLISVRNTLAHGQWKVAFNEKRTNTSTDKTREVAKLTLWHLRLQRNLLDHFVALIYDLIVTRSAFERDFDHHWKNLESARARINRDASSDWEAFLRGRHERGRRHHWANMREAATGRALPHARKRMMYPW
ncbi:hypothetical protein [Streptomyces sp. NBC_00690]|uniref:hypothetical protein n=1 Tax=Streptomyces sp. NBC_00690 TaxID=2975808 RepID=UPI002E2C0683|nr:hypothetical protein [Streptomyces sp. NBC_00690]